MTNIYARGGTIALFALGSLTGCNNVGTSILVQGIAAPDDTTKCDFDSAGNDYFAETLLNTAAVGNAQQLNLRLFARVYNAMPFEPVPVEDDPQEVFVVPNRVSPVRFDFRWECESNGFTLDQGPFFLPQFSLSQPFCLNERDEVSDFIGFDAVPASGASVEADTQGLVSFQAVTPQLGLAMDEFFQIAAFANACCDSQNGCNNVGAANVADPTTPCGGLQSLFDSVSGGLLSANQPADVIRFAPYGIYEGSVGPRTTGSAFGMRMRGRFEFVTAGGDMVTSNELVHQVNFCRNCGIPTTPCTF